MKFNFDLMVVVLAIFVSGVFIYTFYDNIFTTGLRPSNTKMGVFNKFKLALIRLSATGTVSTTVAVTDEELNSLLEVVFREIGSSNQISVGLLKSFGLYTPTVVAYLKNIGYIIISSS